MHDRYPKRLICMTEETTEMLYILGEQDRIVGVSGFTVRPPEARKQKPKISAFTSAKIDKILELKPDLVLGFSDLQADIAADLIKQGVDVHIFNHRSVNGILNMITQLGALVGASVKADTWVAAMEDKIASLKATAINKARRPVVYFEEWNDPIITSIQWVAELVEIAGGIDCFPENSTQSLAKNRILADPSEVIRRNPDIIIGSWCGRKFKADQVRKRAGWDAISAVKNNRLFEIKSSYILQPGPAALTDGLDQLKQIIDDWN